MVILTNLYNSNAKLAIVTICPYNPYFYTNHKNGGGFSSYMSLLALSVSFEYLWIYGHYKYFTLSDQL